MRTPQPRPRRQTPESAVFATIRKQWDSTAGRHRTVTRIAEWAATQPVLAPYRDGRSLVKAAARDRTVLEAISSFASDDDLAMLATLSALLPRLAHLVDIGEELELEEREATLVAIAHETILVCRPGDGSTSWYDRRLWGNISKRYRRWVDRQRSPVDATAARLGVMSIVEADNPGGVDGEHIEPIGRAMSIVGVDELGSDEVTALAELCDWVAEQAAVDAVTARLIVLTRAGGVPIETLVDAGGAGAQTLRRRRLRAEQRLADRLGAH